MTVSTFEPKMISFLRTKLILTFSVFLIIATIISIDFQRAFALQSQCPDRFLKNAMFLLQKNKISEALSTFSQIVQNFPNCPQAEEAEWQLIIYYSNMARNNGSAEFYQLADEHIDFYLTFWPKGTYRKSIINERSRLRVSREPFIMSRDIFIAILSLAVATTLVLGFASN